MRLKKCIAFSNNSIVYRILGLFTDLFSHRFLYVLLWGMQKSAFLPSLSNKCKHSIISFHRKKVFRTSSHMCRQTPTARPGTLPRVWEMFRKQICFQSKGTIYCHFLEAQHWHCPPRRGEKHSSSNDAHQRRLFCHVLSLPPEKRQCHGRAIMLL